MKKDYQVGEWTIQPELNCVSRGTELVHLEPKVMQVLVELSAHSGDVVHKKEDLIHSVWPDTFVGDDALIRCISELRRVFNDNPRSPKYIQTINKMGYRLIAPVTFPPNWPESIDSEGTTAALAAASVEDAGAAAIESAQREQSRKVFAFRWIAAVCIVLIAIAGIWLWGVRGRASASAPFKTIPFTSYPGSERHPAFSPDGNQIVFAWNGEDGSDFWNLYVKLIGSETPLRLTTASAEDMSPAWSPDGNWVAFIRRSPQGNGIYLVPAIGGPERKIYELHCTVDWNEPGLSWSPDGKRLVFPDGKSESNPSSIVSLELDTLQIKPITHPKNSWDGDFGPAFSPDGKTIAFVRGADLGSRGVYVMDADGSEPKQLTSDGQQVHGLAWVSDGSGIVFSSDAGGSVSLWRVPVGGGAIQRMPFGSDKAYTPTISPKGNRLAYSRGSPTWSLMRIDMASKHPAAVKMTSSTEGDSAPKFSHDGQYVAFQSWRSGTQEIWTSSANAAAPVKLTSFNGPLTGSPSWSPDDKQIAFDSRTQGRSHLFALNANGGVPKQLTQGEFNDIIPSWSNDGKSIFFGSKRTDSWQVWKLSVNSGQIQQVTRHGGFVARESVDGNWIYYTKFGLPGLWRMPVAGGDEVKILDGPPVSYWSYFSVSATGIYFLTIEGSRSEIDFFDFAKQSITPLYTLPKRPARYFGLSVSPDDRWIIYTESVSRDADIVLVENFH